MFITHAAHSSSRSRSWSSAYSSSTWSNHVRGGYISYDSQRAGVHAMRMHARRMHARAPASAAPCAARRARRGTMRTAACGVAAARHVRTCTPFTPICCMSSVKTPGSLSIVVHVSFFPAMAPAACIKSAAGAAASRELRASPPAGARFEAPRARLLSAIPEGRRLRNQRAGRLVLRLAACMHADR